MGAAWVQFLKVLVIVIGCLWSTSVRGAPMDPYMTFSTPDEIRAWAKKAFFGGSQARIYSRADNELCVVNGQPTSGPLSSMIVVFGKRKSEGHYSLMLSTGIFYHSDVRDKEEPSGVGLYEKDKLLLVIPFDIVTAGIRMAPVPSKK
jgi:hypothetical protein